MTVFKKIFILLLILFTWWVGLFSACIFVMGVSGFFWFLFHIDYLFTATGKALEILMFSIGAMFMGFISFRAVIKTNFWR